MESNKLQIALVGLGYVGLPLAVEFGKSDLAPVIGLDVKEDRIKELKDGVDSTNEVSSDDLKQAKINFTNNPEDLKKANFIIIAVPTPINKAKKPDLTILKKASETVGKNLSKGAIVVFESTVYPGVTEEICLPIIEECSGLKCGTDWKIGYSPERVNPGDKEHTIDKIVKVISGMDQESLDTINKVYSTVCKAGVHEAANIKTAEAAKVIENTQRDLNIALVNELSLIFEKLDINAKEVIEAAGTKWNFHKYTPGLVGGHCIGVDPYYLTYRAEELGYSPQVILAGRRINDYMPEHVAEQVIKELIKKDKKIKGSKILVLGLAFKENVNDSRNSKIKDTISKLKEYGVEVLGYDPLLTSKEISEFKVTEINKFQEPPKVDGIIISCPHNEFKELAPQDFKEKLNNPGIIFDVKGCFNNLKEVSELTYKSL